MMKNRQPDGCREVLKLKIAIVTGASSGMGREFALQIPQLYKNLDELWVVARRTDRLKSLKEQVKIPVRIFDGDMQRDYIFEKLQRELDRRQADVRMLVNAAGYGKIGNVSDIDLKEQCGMVDLNCTALTRNLPAISVERQPDCQSGFGSFVLCTAGILCICGFQSICTAFFTGTGSRIEETGNPGNGSVSGTGTYRIL